MSSDDENNTTPFLRPKTLPPKLKKSTQNQPLPQSQSTDDNDLDDNDEVLDDGEEEIVIPEDFPQSLEIQLNNDTTQNNTAEQERITTPQLIMLLVQFMCLMYAIYRSATATSLSSSKVTSSSLTSSSSLSSSSPKPTTTPPRQLSKPPINSLQLYSHTILQSSDYDHNNFDYTPFVQDSLQYWSFQHENYYNQKPLPFHKATLTPYSDTTPKVFVQSDLTPFYEAFVRANNYTHFQHIHNEQIDPTLLPQYIPFDPYTAINNNPITYIPLSNNDNIDYSPYIISKTNNITQFQTFEYIPDEYKPRLLKQLVSKQQSHILAPLKQLFELIHNNTNINADVPNLLSPFNIYEILAPTFRSSPNEKQFDIENQFTPLQTLLPSATTSTINNNNNDNNNNTNPLTKQHSAATLKYRRNFVKHMIKHSYDGYLDSCLQFDQVQPITGQCHNIFGNSLTLFDSLSTLYITGLHDELNRSVSYLLTQFESNINGFNRYSSSFELGIRFMGGLASYIDLSGDTRVIPLLEEFVEKWSLSCFPKLTMRNINAYRIGYKEFLKQHPEYKYQPETTHPFNLSRKSTSQQQHESTTTNGINDNTGQFQSSKFYPSSDLRVPIDLDSTAILQSYISTLEAKVNSKMGSNSKPTSSSTSSSSKPKQKQQSTTTSSSQSSESTSTWMPFPHINIVETKGKFDGWAAEYILSEIGTLQIELLAISDIVSNPIYYELGRAIIEHITRNYLVQSITPDHIYHSMGKPQPQPSITKSTTTKTNPSSSTTTTTATTSTTTKSKTNSKANSNTNFDTTIDINNDNKKIDPIILSGYENYIEQLYQNYKSSNSPINDIVTQLQNLNHIDTPLLTTSTIPQLIQVNTIEPKSIDPIQSRLALPQSITAIVPLIPENTALVSPNLLPPDPSNSALIPQNPIDSTIVSPNLLSPDNNNDDKLIPIPQNDDTTSIQYPPLLPTFTFPTFYNKLAPHLINQSTGMTFGGLGDSFYEVLLKQWIMSGKRNNILQNLYLDSIRGLQLYNYFQINGVGMLGLYQPNDSVYLPSLYPQSITHKTDNNKINDNNKQKVLDEKLQDKSITIPTTNNDIIPSSSTTTTTTTDSNNAITSPPLPTPDTTITLLPLPDGTNQITSPPLPNAETSITSPPLPESDTQLSTTSQQQQQQQQQQEQQPNALPDGTNQITSPPLPPSDTEITSPPLPNVQPKLNQQQNELPSPPDTKSIPSPNTKSLPSSSSSSTTTTPTQQQQTSITQSNVELDESQQQRNTLQLSSEHLNCFAGGMLGLGVQHSIIPSFVERQKHLYLAEQLTLSCALSYLVAFHNQTASSEQFSLLTYDLNHTLPKPPLNKQYYVPSNTNHNIQYNLTTYHIHTDPSNTKSQLRLRRYYHIPNELPDTFPINTESSSSSSSSKRTYYSNDPMFKPKLYETDNDEILFEDPQLINPELLQLKHYSINQAVLRSLVRPETVESLYILHSITKSPIYRDLAWFITQSIQILFSQPYGYTATVSHIQNHAYVNTTTLAEHNRRNFHVCENDNIPFFTLPLCQDEHPNGFYTYRPGYMIESGLLPTNAQDSWIIAETLKYLYLIFSEDYEEISNINTTTTKNHNINTKLNSNLTKSYIDYTTNKTHIGHKNHHSSKLLDQWIFTTEAHVLRQRHHLPFLF